MDENGTVPINLRNFAQPLILLSAAFFGIDILIILGLLELLLGILFPMLAWLLFPVFLLVTWILIVSPFIGSVQFLRELNAQSLSWKVIIPLCVLSGMLLLSTVCYYALPSFFHINDTTLQFYCGELFLCAFMSLPAGFVYALRDLRGTGFDTIRSSASLAGAIGLIAAAFFPIAFWMATGKSNNFGMLLIALPLCAIQIAFLMPLLGLKIINLTRTFATIPPPGDVAGKKGEPRPGKKIPDVIREIPKSISPRAKRTVLILAVLALVVMGCFVYWDITDTTPGRQWTRVTTSAPFGSLSGFTSADFKGNLWIIGGEEHVGEYGDAWYTGDGATWNEVSSPAMVPQRTGASSAVFKDALWILGGKTEESHELHNDVWYSGDGRTWSDIQPAAEFSPRFGHSTVIFKDRMWVIGGNQGTVMYDNLTNDVWYSDNGISWSQATPTAEFSPRSEHSSFVYRDKLWVIGGQKRYGHLYDVWNSGDGVHWTQATASAPFGDTSIRAVVFDGRMWVFQTTFGEKGHYPWGTEKSPGIWYSYDGITWTSVMSSAGFFDKEFNGRQPVPIVFNNRLWVLQQHNKGTGIWHTKATEK